MSSIDRRDFLSQSTLAALGALVVSACGDGLGGSPTSPGSVNVVVNLSQYPALGTSGAIVQLSGTSTPIAVVKSANGSYRAFSLVCPHQGTTVGINGASFRCPNHGATFSSTGAWTGGEKTRSLFEFTVTTQSDAGTITITS